MRRPRRIVMRNDPSASLAYAFMRNEITGPSFRPMKKQARIKGRH